LTHDPRLVDPARTVEGVVEKIDATGDDPVRVTVRQRRDARDGWVIRLALDRRLVFGGDRPRRSRRAPPPSGRRRRE
jgi:hypothetical protein